MKYIVSFRGDLSSILQRDLEKELPSILLEKQSNLPDHERLQVFVKPEGKSDSWFRRV